MGVWRDNAKYPVIDRSPSILRTGEPLLAPLHYEWTKMYQVASEGQIIAKVCGTF